MIKTSTNKARDLIQRLEPFETNGALRGILVGSARSLDEGRLPAEWRLRFRASRARIDYVVYSYDTPIGWHLADTVNHPEEWVVPDVKYSATTNRHQGQLPR